MPWGCSILAASMKLPDRLPILFIALGTLALSGSITARGGSAQSSSNTASANNTRKVTAATTPPTVQEIADAKAKGLVWVNTSTKVYHKNGEFYGNTKHSKFMTEDDAKKAGYRAAKAGEGKKSSARSTATHS